MITRFKKPHPILKNGMRIGKKSISLMLANRMAFFAASSVQNVSCQGHQLLTGKFIHDGVQTLRIGDQQ
jgi:hypothetical protein